MIFSEQEAESRRNFYELFHKKLSLELNETDANICKEPWTAATLFDIFASYYDDDDFILSVADVKIWLAMSGITEPVYCSIKPGTVIGTHLLKCLKGYIKDSVYAQIDFDENYNFDSAQEFYLLSTTAYGHKRKKSAMVYYTEYKNFCEEQNIKAESYMDFLESLKRVGVVVQKGYLISKGKVYYVQIAYKEDWNGKTKQGSEEKRSQAEEEEIDDRRKAEIRQITLSRRAAQETRSLQKKTNAAKFTGSSSQYEEAFQERSGNHGTFGKDSRIAETRTSGRNAEVGSIPNEEGRFSKAYNGDSESCGREVERGATEESKLESVRAANHGTKGISCLDYDILSYGEASSLSDDEEDS